MDAAQNPSPEQNSSVCRVTPRDVVVVDRAIATLRAADMLGDAMTELVDLRGRLAGASVRQPTTETVANG